MLAQTNGGKFRTEAGWGRETCLNVARDQVSAAMSRGPGLESAEAQLAAVRHPRAAGGRAADPVQGVGHHLLHLRGGPRALRPGPGPEHRGHVQGDEHCCRARAFSHSLQS